MLSTSLFGICSCGPPGKEVQVPFSCDAAFDTFPFSLLLQQLYQEHRILCNCTDCLSFVSNSDLESIFLVHHKS